ncbi:hypothetical protein [Wenzhouxiangella marina]|uniref:Uncharacterized protein n=1 Tax=Wenzhouxiangella marina TaxID=1579979 RepID=A0A0K0XTR3_9GAMM|nr:hypothetical protein [Wenzhouxiangella marina]AKS41012.1 hypothetical protein WM2015_631 [Wenzhouxiangella marina]MBB6087890.1 hypothetical protein [Wenzhouxiangella marina]
MIDKSWFMLSTHDSRTRPARECRDHRRLACTAVLVGMAGLAMLVGGPVVAQSKQLHLRDGAQQGPDIVCDLADQVPVDFDADSGDVQATVLDLSACLSGPSIPGLSTVLLSPNPVAAGADLQVLWTSTNATVCEPSLSSTLPGWPAESIGLQGPAVYTVPAGVPTGAYAVEVSCQNGSGSATIGAFVSVNGSGPGEAPPPPQLTVNGSVSETTIQAGDSIDIVWSSTNAGFCSASGTLPGWSGDQTQLGSLMLTTSESLPNGQYTVALNCSNAVGAGPTTIRTVTVSE